MNPARRRFDLFDEEPPVLQPESDGEAARQNEAHAKNHDPMGESAAIQAAHEERLTANARALSEAMIDSQLRHLVPGNWYRSCPVTIHAILEARRSLAPVTVKDRLEEAVLVDARSLGNWISPESRDNYLASIMRGTILIGS